MAVQPGPTFKRYAANGAATVYTIPFLLLDPANLQITLNGVAVTSGFTLAGLGNASSSCTFAVPPAGDLLFQQEMVFQRLADYQMNGDFLSQTVNGDYDRLWLAIKQLSRNLGRALAVPAQEAEGISSLPARAARLSKILGFDSLGNPVSSGLTLEQIEQGSIDAKESAAQAAASQLEAANSAQMALAAATNAAADFEVIFDADQAERVAGFNEFLENSGFEMPIDYVEGLSISRPTQIIRYDGELYRAKSASLPFSTTAWATDSGRFFSTGDAVLRQELSTKVKSKRFEATATDDQGTPDALFRVSRTHTIGSSAHAFRDQTIFASNTADRAIASFDAALTVDSPLSVDHVIGFQARSTHKGSGTLNIQYGCGTFNDNTGKINLDYAFYNGNKFNGLVGECFGFYNRPSHFTNTITSYGFVHKPAIGAGATVTNSAGVRIETADGSGTLTNEFGVYVKNLTKGANRWPLFIEQQSGLAYVGAKLQVDQTLQVGGTARLSIGGANGSDRPAIMYNHDPRLNQFINAGDISGFLWTQNNFQFRQAAGGAAGDTPSFTTLVNIHTANDENKGALFPGTTNTQNLGIAGAIWKEIFSGNPTINTSDERVKTEVLSLSINELAAAKQMAKEIGTFKFLEAVADKGDEARTHIGMTVQRAIQILLDFDLEPMTYSFICYDKWDETVVQHEALTIDHAAVIVEHDALYEFGVVVDADGYPIRQRVSDAWSEVVAEAWTETVREAWTEVTPAGDSYGFRATELLSFIAVGFEARLSAIEQQLGLE